MQTITDLLNRTIIDNESRWPVWQRRIQLLFSIFFRLSMKVEVEGIENFPSAGPFILAFNHLSLFDGFMVLAILPRTARFLVTDKFQRMPLVNWFVRNAGNTIYVARGEAGRLAIRRAIATLREGEAIAIAPEGKLSRTGGLIKGQKGIVHMAKDSAAPILPVVAFGQEKAVRFWTRFRRAPVRIRVGNPFRLPDVRESPTDVRGSSGEMDDCTDIVMSELARLLPPEYRGVYATPHQPKESSTALQLTS